MIQKLEGREKVSPHIIANKVNEIIDIINNLEDTGEENEEKK